MLRSKELGDVAELWTGWRKVYERWISWRERRRARRERSEMVAGRR